MPNRQLSESNLYRYYSPTKRSGHKYHFGFYLDEPITDEQVNASFNSLFNEINQAQEAQEDEQRKQAITAFKTFIKTKKQLKKIKGRFVIFKENKRQQTEASFAERNLSAFARLGHKPGKTADANPVVDENGYTIGVAVQAIDDIITDRARRIVAEDKYSTFDTQVFQNAQIAHDLATLVQDKGVTPDLDNKSYLEQHLSPIEENSSGSDSDTKEDSTPSSPSIPSPLKSSSQQKSVDAKNDFPWLSQLHSFDENSSPIYFFDEPNTPSFNQLLAAHDAGFLEIDFETLASSLVAAYVGLEDDLHKGNLGIYCIKNKKGKLVVRFFDIDHDLKFYDRIGSYLGEMRFNHVFHVGDRYRITRRDLLSFPDLTDASPHYWPTYFRVFTKYDSRAYLSRNERNAYCLLKDNPDFIKAKWKYLLKHALLPTSLIQEELLNADAGGDQQSYHLQRNLQYITFNEVQNRLAELRAVLLTIPDIRNQALLEELIKGTNGIKGIRQEINEQIQDYDADLKVKILQEFDSNAQSIKNCVGEKSEHLIAAADTELMVAIKLGEPQAGYIVERYASQESKKNIQKAMFLACSLQQTAFVEALVDINVKPSQADILMLIDRHQLGILNILYRAFPCCFENDKEVIKKLYLMQQNADRLIMKKEDPEVIQPTEPTNLLSDALSQQDFAKVDLLIQQFQNTYDLRNNPKIYFLRAALVASLQNLNTSNDSLTQKCKKAVAMVKCVLNHAETAEEVAITRNLFPKKAQLNSPVICPFLYRNPTNFYMSRKFMGIFSGNPHLDDIHRAADARSKLLSKMASSARLVGTH